MVFISFMSGNNIKKKAVTSMIWSSVQKYASMIISFISGIILARLLTPYDYGCIGMLTIFITLSESFIDGGFGSALIQKKNPTQVDYSTIFFWNLFMSIIMYAILFLSAPFIARFYHIPQLSSVLRVQGVILFIYAFNLIQQNQLRKTLNFKVLSLITVVTSIVSLLATIVLAYSGFGVWSLVTQYILTALIPAFFFWFYVKWRPIWAFSWASFKELFSFGIYMFLTNFLNTFSKQIQGLLIGRLYNAATMGYYSKADSTERLASTSISQVVSTVAYPLYASIQNDKQQLISVLKKLTCTLSYLTTPFLLLLCLTAKPLFILLYSDKWVDCVPYFQILCFAGIPYCLQSANNQSVAAVGKSKEMFVWTVVKRIVGISFIVVGLLLFDMKGLLVGVVLNTWFSYFINIANVSKYVGYKAVEQVLGILPIFIVSGIALGVSYFVGRQISCGLYLEGTIKAIVFLSIYIVWSLICKPMPFRNLVSIIKDFKKK